MQRCKVATSDGITKSEGYKTVQRVYTCYGLSKTPSYPAIKMAGITLTKDGYRDNVVHALSL